MSTPREPEASELYRRNPGRKMSRRRRAVHRKQRRAFQPDFQGLERRMMPTTFMVTNTNDSGAGSLRQAITNSNATPGSNIIDFSIGSGPQTITPASVLPSITVPVVIDGTSQPGYAGVPIIELDGASAGGNATGLVVDGASRGRIRGLVINRFSGDGIFINSSDWQVDGNYLGTDATGTFALGNHNNGVTIDGAAGNTIGGTAAGAGNLISGNAASGVAIFNVTATGNQVQGNLIGTNAAGTSAVKNSAYGVVINSGATGNTVGGTAAGAKNILSGNGVVGVFLTGAGTTANVVAGNYIGTTPDGLAAVANATYGVVINGGASDNLIGGTTAAARNVLSGNTTYGIAIFQAGSNANLVEGNYIGTDSTGTAALPNGNTGIIVNGTASGNTIGGSAPGAANVISGNTNEGVVIAGSGTTGNIVAGNLIGTNAAGTAALANAQEGVLIGGNSSGNTIGGSVSGSRNVISANGNRGIFLNNGADNNLVVGNYIGVDATGEAPLGNHTNDGISINNSSGNTIGGTTSAARNVISANDDSGVFIYGAGANNNLVIGNYLGTDANGTLAFGNVRAGIGIAIGTGNSVGGTAAGAGNLISGNLKYGVYITDDIDSPTGANLVAGNLIGTDESGTAALPNLLAGVEIIAGDPDFNPIPAGVSQITIGGTAAGAGNVISGNGSLGGLVINGPLVYGVLVQGNFIGSDLTGQAALPNAIGVVIKDGATNNTIGGPATGAGNTIAFNQGPGVSVLDASTTGNPIRGNLIYRNLGLAIDLAGDGVTDNHLGGEAVGPNELQNFPVLGSLTLQPGSLSISGSLNDQGNQDYILDFYTTTATDADPSGHGGASAYLGSTVVTTFAGGNTSFLFTQSGNLAGVQAITATATDSLGNTSELAFNLINDQPPVAHITVDSPVVTPDDITVPAGTTVTLDAGTSTDPDGNTLAYTWTFDDNSTAAGVTTTRSFSTPGQYTEYLVADDGFGGLSSDNLVITVTPVPPVITAPQIVPSASAITEGQSITLAASFTDPDPTLTSTVTIDWGDGSPVDIVDLPAGVHNFNGVPHPYVDNPLGGGAFPLTVSVATSDGQSASASIPITVANVSPTITNLSQSASTLSENTDLTISGSIIDPGALDSQTVTIDWGDGLAPLTTTIDLPPGQLEFSATRQYLDDKAPGGTAGTYPISITATDKDSGSTNVGTSVTVVDVAPTVSLQATNDGSTGVLSFEAIVTDPGTLDTFTYAWKATTTDGTLVATGTDSTFSFTAADSTSYDLTLTVTDNSEKSGTTSAVVFVGTPEPDAITISPAGTGQVAITSNGTTFAPVNASDVVVFGLDGNDSIVADPALTVPVELHGGAGDDTLAGAQGNDTIFGGPGSDSMVGGPGDDVLVGQHGNDTYVGGSGDDTFVVVPGSNSVIDATGPPTDDDTIDLSQANSGITLDLSQDQGQTQLVDGANTIAITGDIARVLGTPYNDVFFGNGKNNYLQSGGGNDCLFGGTGDDTLVGAAGNSTLVGGTGDTTILGGTGNESIVGGAGENFLEGTAGNDTIFGGVAGASVGGGRGNSTIFGGTGDDLIVGGYGNVTIQGGAGNNTIFGGLQSDSLAGGLGGSMAFSGGGDESIVGGPGDDTIFGGVAGGSIGGGRGNSTIFGGGGDDLIVGGYGNTTIVATSGDDTIFGGTIHDSMGGGRANSTVFGAAGDELIEGGTGHDTIFGGVTGASVGGGRGNSTIFGGNAGSLIVTGDGNVSAYGGAGDDTIFGGVMGSGLGGDLGDATILGGAGDQFLDGGAGNDTIFGGVTGASMGGGRGNSTIFGDAGDDLLVGGFGNTTIDGGAGDDTIFGGTIHDSMGGGRANSTVFGAAGDELIEGGTGHDTIFGGVTGASVGGGRGNSTIFGGNAGSLIVTGDGNVSAYGGAGNDTIFGGVMGSDLGGDLGDATILGGAGDQFLDGGAGNDTIFGGVAGASMGGGRGNSTIFGDAGDDLLVGGFGNTTIDGGAGDDTIFGGSIHDSMGGGHGNSTVFGSAGLELIEGGSGNDTIFGEAGGGQGSSTIFGGDGDDFLVTGDGAAFAYGEDGDDVLIGGVLGPGFNGGLSNATIFAAQDDQILDGGDGDDTIIGGVFAGSPGGGTGNFIFYGGDGDDVIMAGSGGSSIFGGGGNDSIATGPGDDWVDSGTGDDTVSAGTIADSLGGSGGNATVSGGGAVLLVGSSDGTMILTDTVLTRVGRGTVSFSGIATARLLGAGSDQMLDASEATLPVDLVAGAGDDTLVGGAGDDTLQAGEGDDLLAGGPGSDDYVFGSGVLGSDTIEDSDAPSDANALDFSELGGPATIDLNQMGPQLVSPGLLVLSLPSSMAISDVYGSAFDDVISGNARDNTLAGGGGADSIDGGAGNDLIYGYRSQVVYLDFDSWATHIDLTKFPNQHVYTQEERDAIEARLGAIYADFAFTFTQVQPASGPYETLSFDYPLDEYSGGSADEIDWRDLDGNGSATIDVNQFLGGPAEPSATSANFVSMSATIAAHELGHLSGLLHSDSFGPIGAGVFSRLFNDPSRQYFPAYPGPYAANETPYHIMASPDSVRTDLFAAAGDPYFGEREAIKLAFDDHGQVVQEQQADHQSLATAQPLPMPGLYVPNTLLSGLYANTTFDVRAVDVVGSIKLGPDGLSEDDYYSFQGKADEYLNVEIYSAALTRNKEPIDAILTVYDSSGNVVNYYGQPASNDDSFQDVDPELVDLRLPSDGTYTIEVSTFFGQIGNGITLPDTETGNYELFVYGFADSSSGGSTPPQSPSFTPTVGTKNMMMDDVSATESFSSDSLFGGDSGDDTLVGGAGPTYFRTKATDSGAFNSPAGTSSQAPTANAGGDQIAQVGDLITLEGSFTDPDNTGDDAFQWIVYDSTGHQVAESSAQAFVFTPAAPDLYFASFRITNALGATGSSTALITVNPASGQLSPVVAISGAASVLEGSMYELNLGTSQIDPNSITGWTVNWGDGEIDQVAGDPSAATHVYADGPMSATITATAFAGTTSYPANSAVTVQVGNADPIAVFSSVGSVAEGSVGTVGFTSPFDPSGADAAAGFTYSFDFDDDGKFDLVTNSPSAVVPASLTADGPATITLHGRITDKDGGFTDYTTTLQVLNVAPSATLSVDPPEPGQVWHVGDTITARMSTASDASSTDVVAGLRFSFAQSPDGLASSYATASTSLTAAFVLQDTGVQVVYGRVFDKDGGVTDLIATVESVGVAPTAVLSNTGPSSEGSPVTIRFDDAFSPSPAAVAAGLRYSFALDPSALASAYFAAGTDSTITFLPVDNGMFTIYGRIIDKDDLFTDYTTIVTVNNVAPTANIVTTGPVDEGSPVLVGLLNATDPSLADLLAGFHYSFSLDPSTLASSYSQAPSAYFASFTFTDNGSYTVYGRIFDKDSGYTNYSTTVVVNNVAPTATLSNNGPVMVGNPVTVTFSNAADPSSADTAAGFHYSFATSSAGLASSYAAAGTSNSSSFSYQSSGTYMIYGRIFDKDNGFTDYTTTVTIQPVTTTTTLTTSAAKNTLSLDFPITLTATVARTSFGGGAPGGSVDFTDTTTGIDLGSVSLVNGAGSITTAALPLGVQTISATYGGDASDLPSSTTGQVTVLVSIIVLDGSSSSAASFSGNASVNIPGALVVDSSARTALSGSGNASVVAGSIQVVGGYQRSNNASFHPTPTTGIMAIPDAFSGVSPPTGGTQRGSVNLSQGSKTIDPGIYSQITVSGNASLKLNPGTYIIEGGGLAVSGNANLSGSGVLIVNAGSKYPNSGGTYGSISLSGNGSYNLSPSSTGAYSGIAIFQPRDNGSAFTLSSNASGITGVIYAPAAQLTESGNAQLAAALIVGRLSVSGNGVADSVPLRAPAATDAPDPAIATSQPSALALNVLDEAVFQVSAAGWEDTGSGRASGRQARGEAMPPRGGNVDLRQAGFSTRSPSDTANLWTALATDRSAIRRLWRSRIADRVRRSDT